MLQIFNPWLKQGLQNRELITTAKTAKEKPSLTKLREHPQQVSSFSSAQSLL
jgi:hypothetical protein